jgi:thiol-disulfide isomerase/thioredoxin
MAGERGGIDGKLKGIRGRAPLARKDATEVKRSALVLAAMVAVISLVLWAGWHNLRARRLALQKQQEEHVLLLPDVPQKPGDEAIDTKTDAPSPLLHKPAPEFKLSSLDGKKVSLSDFKGKPLVVNFWATWCAPCKVEMPWFEEFSKKYAADGFEVLGLTDDADAGRDAIAKSATRLGATYPILLTDGKVQKAYGTDEAGYLPMSFYVDRSGTVIAVTAGLGPKDELEAKVKEVIAAGAK